MVKVKKDLTGQKFGRLTVIRQAEDYVNPNTNEKSSRWLCQCECGNQKIVRRGDLQSGKTLSCGCYNKEILSSQNMSERIGEVSYSKYGTKATIIDYKNAHDVLIEFDDQYHYQYKTSYLNFKNHQIINPYDKNVYNMGCFGVGEHTSKEDAYFVWYHIVERCYKPTRRKSDESYIGCEICEDWLIYQNFAEWYNSNFYSCPETLMIDKDLMGIESGYYSPETCVLIPKTLNLTLVSSLKNSKTNKSKNLPIGVQRQKNKYAVYLSMGSNSCKCLGVFKTPQEAHDCYKNAKGNYLLSLLNSYKEYIPNELFCKLNNRITEIYDLKENG